MVEQNLLYAIVLASLGGMFQVLSVLILAYPEHLKQTRGKDFKKPMRGVLVPINVFVQLFNGAATTGAAIFGPVAIIMPVTVSSQLLFNILIFGSLGMEEFGKDVQVGTFIVVLGAVLLPVVGPDVQQDQNIMELITAPEAFAWTSFLFIGVCISGVSCFGCVNTKRWKSESVPVYVTLAVARVFSSVLSASLSKTLALVSGIPLLTVICGFLICGFVLGTSVVLQATKTEQKLFVPLVSCLTQITNAATGLILWEDWKVVKSWVGYSAITVQIVVGVYLISSLDFFANTADPHYALKQSTSLRKLYSREGSEENSGGAIPITHSEFFDDNGNMIHRGPNSTRTRKRQQNKSKREPLAGFSVGSVRGLIGGITNEVSYKKNDNVNTDPTSTLEEDKIFMRSMKMAERAAKNGEDRFVNPPKIFEFDREENFGSIESLSCSDDEGGN